MTVVGHELDATRALLEAGRDPLAATVAQALSLRCEVAPGARLLVGFSGGPDSTALLLLLLALSERGSPACARPEVLHVDHGLRDASEQEADHVLATCRSLDVRCSVVRPKLDAEAPDLSRRARDARYLALESRARDGSFDAVVVAHHAEDRLESILQALCRGSGVRGLSSPRWSRPLGATRLVRPLLGSSRTQLVEFCLRLSLPHVLDPTNERLDTARGLLRSRVLDVLETRWPGAALRASAAADRAGAAAIALEDQLEIMFGPVGTRAWPRRELRGADVDFLAAGIRRAVTAEAPELADSLPASRLLEIACAASDEAVHPRRFELPGGWVIDIDSSELHLSERPHSVGR
jgi:tRNA(Ile)-lysidine synthetase-like protein